MKKNIILITAIISIGFCSTVFAQSQQEKINHCEEQATYFKNKISSTEHAYSYIAQISYVDCLVDQFPNYKQRYVSEQIMPSINSLKAFGSLSDMPSDAQALLRKYW